jgi:hypothetical protein
LVTMNSDPHFGHVYRFPVCAGMFLSLS